MSEVPLQVDTEAGCVQRACLSFGRAALVGKYFESQKKSGNEVDCMNT